MLDGKARHTLCLVLSGVALSSCGSSAERPPYADPGAHGRIALCGPDGQPVRSGSLDDKPFTFTAVSSDAAPAGYDGPRDLATLAAFQPRRGVEPGQWSGQVLTAGSRYTNRLHPMVQSVAGDPSLGDFVRAFPATDHGYVQLRIVLSGPDKPVSSAPYSAADLKVTGRSWTVVRGADGPCTSGRAVSMATLLGVPSSAPQAPSTPPSAHP